MKIVIPKIWCHDPLTPEEIIAKTASLPQFHEAMQRHGLSIRPAYSLSHRVSCKRRVKTPIAEVLETYANNGYYSLMEYRIGHDTAHFTPLLLDGQNAFRMYLLNSKTKDWARRPCNVITHQTGRYFGSLAVSNIQTHAASNTDPYHVRINRFSINRPTAVSDILVRFHGNGFSLNSDTGECVMDEPSSYIQLTEQFNNEKFSRVTIRTLREKFPDIELDFTRDIVLDQQDVALIMGLRKT